MLEAWKFRILAHLTSALRVQRIFGALQKLKLWREKVEKAKKENFGEFFVIRSHNKWYTRESQQMHKFIIENSGAHDIIKW